MSHATSFYLLREPHWKTYTKPLQYEFINGKGNFEFRLPAAKCDLCDGLVRSTRVLPTQCPTPLRHDLKSFTGCDRNLITIGLFRELSTRWKALLNVGDEVDLEPGTSFQPFLWTVPSRPRFDFYWPPLQVPLVSQRVANAFRSSGVQGISFSSVAIQAMGTLDPQADFERTLKPEPQRDGIRPEPWDSFVDRIPMNDDLQIIKAESKQFFAVDVEAAIDIAQASGERKGACSRCDRMRQPSNADKRIAGILRSKRLMPFHLMQNRDVCASRVHEGFVLSERAYKSLSPFRLTNVEVVELQGEDSGSL